MVRGTTPLRRGRSFKRPSPLEVLIAAKNGCPIKCDSSATTDEGSDSVAITTTVPAPQRSGSPLPVQEENLPMPTLSQALVKSFQNIEELLKILKGKGGPLTEHLKDALGISPEISHMDIIDMPGTVTSATSITQPSTVRVHSEMDFEVFGLSAYISALATTFATDVPLVTFNIRESGRSFDMFTTDLNLSSFVSTAGSLSPMIWDRGLYKFRGGSDVKVTLKAASGYTTARTVGVVLWGNLIKRK